MRPRLPCLYTALTPEGAIAELEKHKDLYVGRYSRRDLVSIEVTVVDVLDLTRAAVCRRHGIDQGRLTRDGRADLAYCRTIAQRLVLGGAYRAIRAPSAALSGGETLMIYANLVHIRRLKDGPDRVPIFPGYRWTGP